MLLERLYVLGVMLGKFCCIDVVRTSPPSSCEAEKNYKKSRHVVLWQEEGKFTEPPLEWPEQNAASDVLNKGRAE